MPKVAHTNLKHSYDQLQTCKRGCTSTEATGGFCVRVKVVSNDLSTEWTYKNNIPVTYPLFMMTVESFTFQNEDNIEFQVFSTIL